MREQNIYYAKIILFGEYGVIFDSMALTIPFIHFHGQLNFISRYNYTDIDYAQNSNQSLIEYFDFLKEQKEKGRLQLAFDINHFEKDIKKGLYFESSIPQSYGLGSSGALVAALYQRYAENPVKSSRTLSSPELLTLKSGLSELESFFHGQSSGIDPLNAYIRFPLLIKNKSEITTVTIPRNKDKGNGAIFLINTGGPGKTEPLVHLFMDKCKIEDYYKVIHEEYIPISNSSIIALLSGKLDDFFNNVEKLSNMQLCYMNQMIPYAFQEHWKNGLQTKDYYMKLCGSGGGGYLLGFTKDFDKARRYFKDRNIEVVSVYRSLK